MKAIDLDRGVVKRIHRRSGMAVYMYKSEPGVYRTVHGEELTEKMAAEAGYDVAKLSREKERRDRMAEAMRRIQAEFDDEPDSVVYEKEGFTVAAEGQGVYGVYSPEGGRLTDKPLTKADAVSLVDQLAAMELKPDDDDDEPKGDDEGEQKDEE